MVCISISVPNFIGVRVCDVSPRENTIIFNICLLSFPLLVSDLVLLKTKFSYLLRKYWDTDWCQKWYSSINLTYFLVSKLSNQLHSHENREDRIYFRWQRQTLRRRLVLRLSFLQLCSQCDITKNNKNISMRGTCVISAIVIVSK